MSTRKEKSQVEEETQNEEKDDSSEETLSEEEEEEEDVEEEQEEIVDVLGVMHKAGKSQPFLKIKWNNGDEEAAEARNVIADDVDKVIKFLEMKKGRKKDLLELCDMILRMIKTKKRRVRVVQVMKDLQNRESVENDGKCKGGVRKEKGGDVCRHHDLPSLEKEEIGGVNCLEGYKLFNCICAKCNGRMVARKRKGEVGTIQPSRTNPVYCCMGIYSCKFVLCGKCYSKELLKQDESTGGRRSTRRNGG